MHRSLGLVALSLLTTLALPLAPAGAQAPPGRDRAAEQQEVPIARILGIPAAFLMQAAKQLPEGTDLPVSARVTTADGKPAAGIPVVLVWKDGERRLTTDANGGLEFGVPGDRLTQARLRVPKGLKVSRGAGGPQVTVHSGSGGLPGEGGGDAEEAVLDRLDSVTSGGLAVYFPKGRTELGLEGLAELARIEGFVDGFSGMRLGGQDYGLALLESEARALRVTGRVLLPFSVAEWRDREGAGAFQRWGLVHEWVEMTILFGGLYFKSDAFRMAGDGLAELHSFAYCDRYHPAAVAERLDGYRARVRSLLEAGRTTYDMPTLFRARVGDGNEPIGGLGADERAGYAVSFWFWKKVLEMGGHDALRTVQSWLLTAEAPTLEQLMTKVDAAAGRGLTLQPKLTRVAQDLNRWIAERTPAKGADAPAEPAAEFLAPLGKAPSLDGTIRAGEWDDARAATIGGSRLLLKHDGAKLYVALDGSGTQLVNLFCATGGQVRVLHASARIGTAVYAAGDGWKRTQGFAFSAPDEAFRTRQGWTGTTARMGRSGQMEFAVDLDRLKLRWESGANHGEGVCRLAVAVFAPAAQGVAAWPESAGAGARSMPLLMGRAPEGLALDPESWQRVGLGRSK